MVWIAAALALTAAGAVAAATSQGLFDRDVTRADIDARATHVLRASDGVLFVDPSGLYFVVEPGGGVVGSDSASPYGRELGRSLRSSGTNGENVEATLELPGGGKRIIRWTRGEGAVTVTDEHADGTTVTETLHSGDVVPLVPGSLTDQPLTPDKAVTFELEQDGTDYDLWIYPQRNEAYVATPPWDAVATPTTLTRELERHFGLTDRADPRQVVPIDSTGGRWTFTLDDGADRTVTWKAGDRSVTVTDRAPGGAVRGEETLPIGTRVFAG